ncbi:MAG: hypothetical protein HFG26_02045 [Provencibacterium sp.]|nr:hypothetical protein [Provencibacterium sp.]
MTIENNGGVIMKRTLIGILAAATVLAIGVTSAFAAAPVAGQNFTDADGDGICDYFGSACDYADTDNDGVCDNCGRYHKGCMAANGYGGNFVDADGDGVCDNYAFRQAQGRGNGFRGGRKR